VGGGGETLPLFLGRELGFKGEGVSLKKIETIVSREKKRLERGSRVEKGGENKNTTYYEGKRERKMKKLNQVYG